MMTVLRYKGFEFNVYEELYPFAENEQELINRFKNLFDRCGEEIISSTVKGPLPSMKVVSFRVNWKRYFVQNRTYRGEQKLDDYVKILIALGVLSFKKEQNWLVVNCGMNLNPKMRDLWSVYFTDRENAVAYAEASPWPIDYVAKLGEVVPSGDIKKA